MNDDVYYIKYINRAILANLQRRPLKLGRLIVPQKHTYNKKFCSHGKSLFSGPHPISFPDPGNEVGPHPLDFNMLVFFSSQYVKRGHKLELTYLYSCQIIDIRHHLHKRKWNAKDGQMPLILGRSGIQYITMVTILLILYCGAHLVDSSCKESKISDTYWLRYLFSSYLIKTWLIE